jgi:hypothetical protein
MLDAIQQALGADSPSAGFFLSNLGEPLKRGVIRFRVSQVDDHKERMY